MRPQNKNLKKGKPFKKNDPRINKKGRPPLLPNLDILLAEVLGEEKDGMSAAKVILMAMRAKATKGDVRAAEVLLDRAFGKAKQVIEATGKDGADLLTPTINILPLGQTLQLARSENEIDKSRNGKES